jgi:pyruvate kinase
VIEVYSETQRAVKMMAETCILAEGAIAYPVLFNELRALTPRPTSTAESVAIAAVAAASEQGASAIVVLSTSGNTSRLVSKYRPSCPIITGVLVVIVLMRSLTV